MTTGTATTPPRAAGSGSRVVGVDVARGLAVLGMVAVHVLPLRDAGGVRTTADLLVSGRSAATFAVLAGVGVALAARGRRRRTALVVRGLAIGLLGLALGSLDSGVLVILGFYGAFFVLLAPLCGLRARAALGAAAVVALTGPLLSQVLRVGLDGTIRNPVLADLTAPAELGRLLVLTGTYPALPWLAYLLLGLGIGQLDLRRPSTALRLLLAGVVLAVAAHAASALLLGPLGGYDALAAAEQVRDALRDSPQLDVQQVIDASRFGAIPTGSTWWLAVDARHSSTPLDLAATGGIALAVLGACLLAARPAGWWLAPLAAVGSMPLTVYTAHVLWPALTETGTPKQYYVAQVLVALVAAPLWRHGAGRGPLEAALAWLTRLLRR